MDFSGGAVVKSLPANARGSREAGSIAGSGRPRGIGNGKLLQYLAWKMPWAEEPDGLQSLEWQRVGHNGENEHPHIAVGIRRIRNIDLMRDSHTSRLMTGGRRWVCGWLSYRSVL